MTACTICGAPLPAYFAVLSLSVCTLCRVLGASEPGGTHSEPRIALQQRKFLARAAAPPGPVPVSADSDAMVKRIGAWATAHHNAWPRVRDFQREPALPSLRMVRERWGTVVKMRLALQRAYPQFQGRKHVLWTHASICEAFATWIARHPSLLPMTEECRTDGTLPSPSVVHDYFKGLRQFYSLFEEGKYAAQFGQTVVTRRRAASVQGYAAKQAKKGAR